MNEGAQPDQKFLGEEYQLHMDLYKHYLRLVLEFSVFYYAVTGGIVSFYFSRSEPQIIYSLLLPVVMSFAFGVLFFYGAVKSGNTRQRVHALSVQLGIPKMPEVGILTDVLWISGGLFMFVGIGLLGVFCLKFSG